MLDEPLGENLADIDHDEETLRFIKYLVVECGYSDIRILPGRRYVAIMPLLYTHAIIIGSIGDQLGYADRWCYGGRAAAIAALEAWDGQGEPEGWHRHPGTGRRREYDAETSLLLGEYINP